MATSTTRLLVERMRDAAHDLLEALDPAQVAATRTTLDDPAYRQWSYLPGDRAGLRLGDLDHHHRDLFMGLLDTGCSALGARLARDVIALDIVRRGLGGGNPEPGDHRFWVRVFGSPRDEAFAWRVNGHHLAVHVAVVGDDVAVTPSFFGSEPATVLTGPHKGMRVLTTEEDLARTLLGSLDEDQRRQALTDTEAPPDIRTRNDPVADPSVAEGGIAHPDLRPDQQALLHELVRHYFGRTPDDAAARAWAEAQEAGLDAVRFAWAGGTEPGQGHYYSVLGPTFLLEYDNTQDDANHIHSVWRDLRHDWGDDLLARHYAEAPHRG